MLKQDEQFATVIAPGVGGWVNFFESETIPDNALADVTNAVFDGGFISPRQGSSLFAAKPTGETASPLQLVKTQTSDGVEYLISVYGNKFYVYHPTVGDWVKITHTYTPAETTLYFGTVTWNNGRGDDRFYACNGVNNFLRWDLCVTTVASNATAGATTVTLTDATRFPASGTVVFKSGGSEFTEAYTSKSGNVLNLTGTLNENLTAGQACVMMAVEKSGMEVGKILQKHGGRLFVANYFGGETTVWYSKQNDPEDFTTGAGITTASTAVIADGNGGITGMHDFGKFLLIEKEDSLHSFEIFISEDLGSKLDKINPIISGTSMGPLSMPSVVKVQNQLFYPTRTEGFMSLNPVSSGDSASTGMQIISQNIQQYTTSELVYTNTRSAAYKQKCFWTVGTVGSNTTSFVMMYDIMRQAWTRFSGWSVKDFATYNDELYFLELGTGNVVKCYDRSYNDSNNPYPVEWYSKRFNFGLTAEAKTMDKLYLQGYMVPASEFYVDVLFNEEGILGKMTYYVHRGADGILYSDPVTNAQGQRIMGTSTLGFVEIMRLPDLSFFRTYLDLSNNFGFFNAQLRFYSNKEAFWAITGFGFNPQKSPVIDAKMVISPIAIET